MRVYQKKRRAEDPELAQRLRQQQARRKLEHRQQRKQKAIEYKGGCCADCEGVFLPAVYDFHHLDPTAKDLAPAQALSGTWERAKAELDKCVLLCANCHRTRHASEQFN